ncbi:unnamed protein product [Polarella glacialis]|uniref:Uncharacterized protein n=1 Tax=Polarella glacialis TaxID=89957 RepID=A0A813D619_POLGL|nr:unnamed protein product [Polarella glacialis]
MSFFYFAGVMLLVAVALADAGQCSAALVNPRRGDVFLQRNANRFGILPQAEPGKRNIALVTLADKRFQQEFAMQLMSIRCYAKRHNYQVKLLEGNEYDQCSPIYNLFFRKHCTIAKWMESQPANLVVAVLDLML